MLNRIIFSILIFLLSSLPLISDSKIDGLFKEYSADRNGKWWLVRDIGLRYGELKQYEHSAKYLEEARILFRKYKPEENTGYFVYHLGLAYLEMNNTLAAIGTLESALNEDPPETDRTAILRLLAETYLDGIDRAILSKTDRKDSIDLLKKLITIPSTDARTQDEIKIRRYLLNSSNKTKIRLRTP